MSDKAHTAKLPEQAEPIKRWYRAEADMFARKGRCQQRLPAWLRHPIVRILSALKRRCSKSRSIIALASLSESKGSTPSGSSQSMPISQEVVAKNHLRKTKKRIPAIVQGLARSRQTNGGDKLQVEPGQAEMMGQGTMIPETPRNPEAAFLRFCRKWV